MNVFRPFANTPYSLPHSAMTEYELHYLLTHSLPHSLTASQPPTKPSDSHTHTLKQKRKHDIYPLIQNRQLDLEGRSPLLVPILRRDTHGMPNETTIVARSSRNSI